MKKLKYWKKHAAMVLAATLAIMPAATSFTAFAYASGTQNVQTEPASLEGETGVAQTTGGSAAPETIGGGDNSIRE